MPALWRLIPSSVLRRRKNTKNANRGGSCARVPAPACRRSRPPRHEDGGDDRRPRSKRHADVASPPRCALRHYQLPALCAMPRKPAHRRSTLSSLRRQCLMRDHPLTSSSTPHPRTLSTTSSHPQCVTRCYGATHRPSKAHTTERRRAASQPPSQTLHHPQQTAAPSERSNGDASATTRGPMPPTTRPPPRPQCKARPPPKHQHPPRQQPPQPTTHAAPPHSGGHHHAPPINLYSDERMGGLWAGAPPTARAQTREGARAGR